jgi:hypothetical protein
MESDRRADAQPGDPPSRQRVLYHEFASAGKKFTCQPDAACLIHIPRDPDRPAAGSTPLLSLWEIDRSTERTAQVARKCPGYAALLKQRDYRRYWPEEAAQPAVRVFWVCRSRQRIDSLTAALRDEPAAESFRFTTAAELRPETALTLPIWSTIAGERREILRWPALMQTPVGNFAGHPAPHLPAHVGP